MKLLDVEINAKKKSASKNRTELQVNHLKLANLISLVDMILIDNFITKNLEILKISIKNTHEKKLESLGIKNNIEPCDPDKVIFNFSSIRVPPRVKYLLAFGLDFGLPVFKLDFVNYFFGFEKLAHNLKSVKSLTDHEIFYKKLKFIAQKFFYGFKSSKVFSIFTKEDIMKIKQFSKNQNIVVAQPDKGKGIVLLDKPHYIAGLSKIVADQEKFELITDDICRVSWLLEDRINSFLLKLKNLHHLSSVLYNQLHVSGSGPGTLYGLAKIHKMAF